MKKKFPVPLELDCQNLNSKLIVELADELRMYFLCVDVSGDEIYADGLLNDDFRPEVEAIIKKYGVKVIEL